MKHFLITFIAFILFALPDGYAQLYEYAYQNTIEFGIGTSHDYQTYNTFPDKGLGMFGRGGGIDNAGIDLSLRYTRFFSRHWGAFFELGFDNLEVGDEAISEYLEKNKAKNDPYDYFTIPEFICWCSDDNGSVYPHLMVGPTYRYDFGRWSLRGRVGMGYTRFLNSGAEYHKKNGDDVKWVDYAICDKRGETIYNYDKRCFSLKPSIQLTFTPRRHMFISLEVSYLSTFMRANVSEKTYTFKPWEGVPEGDYLYYNQGTWNLDSQKVFSTKIGNPLAIRFGFGWNIGWNQNQRNK